jgi:hypothetical protein
MDSLRVVAAPGRAWRAYAGPVALLLAATIAAAVFRAVHHTSAPTPPPAPVRLYQSTTPIPPVKRLYRVVAGDTLAGIATKTDVPLARIRALNPSVSPTALFIGEKIRLR